MVPVLLLLIWRGLPKVVRKLSRRLKPREEMLCGERERSGVTLDSRPELTLFVVSRFALDVTDEENWKKAIAFAEETYGPLDVLVNNAGIAQEVGDHLKRVSSLILTNLTFIPQLNTTLSLIVFGLHASLCRPGGQHQQAPYFGLEKDDGDQLGRRLLWNQVRRWLDGEKPRGRGKIDCQHFFWCWNDWWNWNYLWVLGLSGWEGR